MTPLTDADYARAEQMLAPHRARRVRGAAVTPHWLSGEARFRYQVGPRHVVVDPAAGTRRDLVDHDRLAAALSEASGHAVDGASLVLGDLDVDGDRVLFSAFDARWSWSGETGDCVRVDGEADGGRPAGPGEHSSPDGAWVAFLRDGDVRVRSRDGKEEFALTDDAEPDHGYGGVLDFFGHRTLMRSFGLDPAPVLAWSPDSTRILVHRLDQRHVAEQVLVESAPPDGGRPREHRYRTAIPGDEAQPTMSWNVLDVATGSVVRQRDEPCVVTHPSAMQVYRWWSGPAGEWVHVLHHSRDGRSLELRRMDPATGESTTLVSETGRTRLDPMPQYTFGEPPMVRVLEGGEILWWSQRDGWGHLYLYPADGADPVQLTSGPWLVTRILGVDEERRRVFFLAGGLVGDDPYVRQICRVDLDGTGVTRLTDDELDHDALCPPGGGYVVDRASTPAVPPRSRVLDADGRVLVELESPDADELRMLGWTPPERFCATAADGTTPVYGLLWRPHGFDPGRRYPAVDHVYPGPQVSRTSSGFDNDATGDPEALAALGFVVVAIDGRGTPGRSKAFHDHSYGALGDAGALADHVAAIRELGLRHPWIDTGRVGITGHSGGGFATARALLAHPGFYSVGVALAGNHDNGVYQPFWAEQYHGDLGEEGLRAISNPALAANLQGKLLLIHGELDDNVHPTQTLRLVDALVAADKDVDMLIVPGGEHSLHQRRHHVVRRTWDHLVRHLHGTEPPRYRVAPLPLGG
ncbi:MULTISPECIES: DPP IV N-terminal domain-containing protein [unclassified Pseudonocardia]|uniref:S9 family peptidase n=1 Tax=unclassified Pseudonocardia TaxID=2619320 RepID=UPI0001FFDF77|nr:DPP IV N-terminal domain-containing protein [Pseudonocardia sp. Ae707_Ps1]OLM17580.1 Dipeptidyl peptidase IV [Pseudonocardia sp. Ae707_Ps1]